MLKKYIAHIGAIQGFTGNSLRFSTNMPTLIETEYNAISTERDSIKKLIASNSEKSFKLFG